MTCQLNVVFHALLEDLSTQTGPVGLMSQEVHGTQTHKGNEGTCFSKKKSETRVSAPTCVEADYLMSPP